MHDHNGLDAVQNKDWSGSALVYFCIRVYQLPESKMAGGKMIQRPVY